MSWAGKQHPVETLVEWLAPVPLAMAVGWSGTRLEFSPGVAFGAALGALIVGLAAMRLGSEARPASVRRFEPSEFKAVEPEELILEEADSVLELDDRLDDVGADSRVVRLFARQDPTPGELVDRIVDFLGENRRPSPSERPSADGGHPDARDALHQALANIRASLR